MLPPLRPTPADIASLALAVERDEQQPADQRALDDRQFREAYTGDLDDRPRTALAWLAARCERDPDLRATRERALLAQRGATLLMILWGVLAGLSATAAIFAFDGSARVNVVVVFAVFVLLPAVLLLPFLLAALPPAALRWLPGATAASVLSQALSPGRLARVTQRLLPRDWREAAQNLTQALSRHRALYARMQRWALLRWSQVFAVAYMVTAVVSTFALVVFSDLAFGWSTTLTTGDANEDARRLHAMTSSVSLPWGWAMESAVPSRRLIESSRYFRAASGTLSVAEAAELGGWWRFLVLAMLVYGLLPRVGALALCESRLRHHARGAIGVMPGLGSVLRRLRRTRVETTALEPEESTTHRANLTAPEAAESAADKENPTAYAGVINWAGVPVDDAVLGARFQGAPVHHAGGGASLEAEQRLVRELAARGSADSTVALIVKGWEPPLLELIDFLAALRRAAPTGMSLMVVPVGLYEGGTLRPADEAHLHVWRQRLRRVGDPWLHVEQDLPKEKTP